jgi:hypothetical protein
MRKQTRDLISITLSVFMFGFFAGMIVLLPLYGLAFLLGHGYPIRIIFLGDVFFNLLGTLVCLPLLFHETGHLSKDDPFRISPKLNAYFRLPESVDAEKLLKLLQRDFVECQIESPSKLRAAWVRKISDDGLKTYQARFARKMQLRPRLVTIKFLNSWEGFKVQRVEVSIETGAPIKLINGEGLNQIALQVLVDSFGWGNHRVPVDHQGRPQW